MDKRQLRKRITLAQNRIRKQMAQAKGMYGRGLANEGWAGGYDQALSDISLLLNDVEPDSYTGFLQRTNTLDEL